MHFKESTLIIKHCEAWFETCPQEIRVKLEIEEKDGNQAYYEWTYVLIDFVKKVCYIFGKILKIDIKQIDNDPYNSIVFCWE